MEYKGHKDKVQLLVKFGLTFWLCPHTCGPEHNIQHKVIVESRLTFCICSTLVGLNTSRAAQVI
jgi:hypothetical protein